MSEQPGSEKTQLIGPPPAEVVATRLHQNALPVGTRLGEFEIIDLVGEGGFGIVYLAQDHSLHRKVALKEYMPALLASRGQDASVAVRSERQRETFDIGLRSFVNEARMLAQFDHPALIKVFRFWEANGTAYMVMPFLSGKTLQDALKARSEPPGEAWIRGLLSPLMEALAVLHEDKVYHRDIAPDNIMLLAGDRPVLLDFGAARKVISDMTHALTVILKPGYAPIEQYADMPGMKQGPWTDVYALAAVVYFMILGKKPPPSVSRLMEDSYEPLMQSDAAGRYSAELLQGIDRCLAVRAENRPQNMAAMREAITVGAAPVAAHRDAGGARPAARHRGAAAGAAHAGFVVHPYAGPNASPNPGPGRQPCPATGRVDVRADHDRGPAVAAGGEGGEPGDHRRLLRDRIRRALPGLRRGSQQEALVHRRRCGDGAGAGGHRLVHQPTGAGGQAAGRGRAGGQGACGIGRGPPRAASAAARAAHRQRRRRHRRGGRRRRPGLRGDAGSARRRAAWAATIKLAVHSKSDGMLNVFVWDRAADRIYRLASDEREGGNAIQANASVALKYRDAVKRTAGEPLGQWRVVSMLSERPRDFSTAAFAREGEALVVERGALEARLAADGLASLFGKAQCAASAPCPDRFAISVADVAQEAAAPPGREARPDAQDVTAASSGQEDARLREGVHEAAEQGPGQPARQVSVPALTAGFCSRISRYTVTPSATVVCIR